MELPNYVDYGLTNHCRFLANVNQMIGDAILITIFQIWKKRVFKRYTPNAVYWVRSTKIYMVLGWFGSCTYIGEGWLGCGDGRC